MNPETFFDKFGLLADTPNGVQKLRELILQLAVQGKLVPQDPNDEPATVLLEKIKAEKEKLVKEGIIKKSKPLPPIENDKIPYITPNNWKWERLGNIGNATNYPIVDGPFGSSINTKDDYISSGIPVIRMVNVKPFKFINENLKFIKKEKYESLERHNILPNDVLLGKVGSIGNSCIFPEYITYGLLSTTGLCRFRVGNIVTPKYLCYFLNGISSKLKELASTNVQPFLNMNTIKNIQIPIPPFEEQRRIVAKVDQLMALCDELEARQQKKQEARLRLNSATLDKLLTAHEPAEFANHWQRVCDNFDLLYDNPETVGELRKDILQLAVQGKLVRQDENDVPAAVLLEKIKVEKEKLVKGKKIKKSKPMLSLKENDIPFNLPLSWAWIPLGEVVDYNGASKVPPNDIPDDAWLLDLENIEKDTSKIIKRIIFKDKKSKSTKSKFENGDVLYGKLRPYLNKVVVADGAGYCTTEIIPLRGYYGIFPKYLMYALKRPDFLEYANSKTYGVKMPRLGTEDARNAPFPLPPFEEQRRIVAKVDQLMALFDELEAKLNQSHTDGAKLMEAVVAELVGA